MNPLSLLLNLKKIKEYVGLAVLVVTKLRVIVEFLEKEFIGTGIATSPVGRNFPLVKKALDRVIELIGNVATLFGVQANTFSSQSVVTLEQASKQLEDAIAKVDKVL